MNYRKIWSLQMAKSKIHGWYRSRKFICRKNLCKGCRVDDFCNGYLIPHHYLLLQRIWIFIFTTRAEEQRCTVLLCYANTTVNLFYAPENLILDIMNWRNEEARADKNVIHHILKILCSQSKTQMRYAAKLN